ncbi:MAG: IMP dehydrogenase, partial [Candidatus Cloacimonadota bacterium]|nr:IMP dehydrogenase [Candidatus Cloacimonadota bacterium]
MAKILKKGFTFDDLLLIPQESKVLPSTVDLSTMLTPNLKLNIPIMSAAMDTVTEAQLAIAMAREGGIGVIHKNLTIEQQAHEVNKVKRSESGIINNPITLSPDASIREANMMQKKHNISGFPIVKDKKLVGILTNRDLRFEKDLDKKVSDLMTKGNKLITVLKGTDIETAKHILHKNRIEKLLIKNENGELSGMITVKDIMKGISFPSASKDTNGSLLVGAAIGVSGDYFERAQELVAKGVDTIVIDTAHGHHINIFKAIEQIKKNLDIEIIAGNV